MAKPEACEEGAINAAYEAFKETYDNIIEVGRSRSWGLEDLPEPLDGLPKEIYIPYAKSLLLKGLKRLCKEIEADVIESAKQCGVDVVLDEEENKGGINMLKSYNPIKACGQHHIVEATYMIDAAQIIVRIPAGNENVGLNALENSDIIDSDWVGDLDGSGEFEDIKLIGIERLDYDASMDELIVFLSNGKMANIDGHNIKDYLVKVEIIKVDEVKRL